MSCPSRLRLDDWLAERRDSRIAAHVEACAQCRARVIALEGERADFLRRARPAAFAEVVLAHRSRRRWWAPVLALAAACALVFLLRPHQEPDEAYKAGEPDAQLWVRRDGVLKRYEPGTRYVSGDVVQVVVLTPRAVWVSVVDVEQGGNSQLLYATEQALPPGRTRLQRSFELDDWRGGEELVVLFADRPIDDAVARARRGEGRRYPIAR